MIINKRGMFAVRIARTLMDKSPEERADILSVYSTESRRLIEYASKTLQQQTKLKGKK